MVIISAFGTKSQAFYAFLTYFVEHNNLNENIKLINKGLYSTDGFVSIDDSNSLLLPSVTTDSDASGIKVQCTFVHEMMDPMDPSIIETTKFSPKVYYNWNGSGTYQDATDAEKLNKANYSFFKA